MNSSKTLIRNGKFIVPGTEAPVLSGCMVIENDLITYIGEAEPALAEEVRVIDGSRLLFMPGLVNSHGHAAMSLLRGYGDDRTLQVWLQEKMWPMEGKFTPDDIYWGSALAILEMMKGGTTTFLDMYVEMDRVAEITRQSGLRGVLTRGVLGFCSREEQDHKLAEAIRFARDWNGQADGRITTMLSPHAPYTSPPDFFERFVQAAHDFDLPMHTHMSETKREVEQNVNDHGMRPVAYLEKLGMFSRPSLVAHAVHLNDEEIGILARHHVAVSHNPGSNLKLASGMARVTDLLNAGITVSLGTDSAASNNNLDLFEEMRLAALIHKGVSGDPTAVPAAEAFRMATENGAKSLFLPNVGKLAAGMKADFIAIDLDQPHLLPYTNLLSHAVYSASAKDVRHVWVNGQQIVKNGACLTLDEEEIRRKAQETFEELLKR